MIVECKMNILNFATQMFKLISLHKNNKDIICKLDGLVQLNNKPDKSLYCCNKILLYFITELLFTFFFLKYQNHFISEGGEKSLFKNSGNSWGQVGPQRHTGTENPGGWGRVWIFSGTTHYLSVTGNLRLVNKTRMQHIFRNKLDYGQRIS